MRNKEQNNVYMREYYKKNKQKLLAKNQERFKKYPWLKIYYGMRARCNNPNSDNYKYYGGRNIKCLITVEELEFLWYRDKAYSMKKPSIDRKDNDGNYTLKNCHFIELEKNISKAHKGISINRNQNGEYNPSSNPT